MGLIADGLMIAAALTAAIYCHVLAGRLRSLRRLDGGVGQAVAAMAAQTDELRQALRAARAAAGESTRTLAERTARAEMAAGRLELLLAAIHDNEGGAAPANVAARREARQAAAFSPRPRPQVVGGSAAARAAGPLEAPFVADPDEAPDPDLAEAGAPPDVEPDPDEAPAEAADDAAEAGDAPPTDAAAPPATRRLFRIEVDPADPDDDPAVESVARTARAAPRARPARGRGLGDSAEGTDALRAAIEALARESGE
ncbi:hypothetical protein [Albimonas pacifica]|uniref:Uncharacterized protein n=1 Tax=Albimonas pacifica TaxID=1114924 RepID=A0A1I3FQS3_9RHOB|nr:hypothetical protein [Albimonas pacifica]SFI13546.1 hypothetical protein SAMN05216258_104450 [Albimonas pacifica]